MEALPLRRVVLTGGECTGKTTLASLLARRLDSPVVPEFVREYATRKGAPLDASDVEPIARGQIAAQDRAAERTSGLLVLDTDIVSTVVYARHYYGACPAWVEAAARSRLADLYLLLPPDLPWEPDGIRDRPDRREEVHELFRATLAALGARVLELGGPWDERLAASLAAVAGDRPTR
jgi:NadR type nicotinamide-nucleotide adenylyltransferase